MAAAATRPGIPGGITAGGVVAIGRRVSPGAVPAIAAALAAGGIRAFELTLNEPKADALRAIEAAARVDPDLGLEIGAGTVLSIEAAGSRVTAADVDAAARAGLFDGARWLHLTGLTHALSAGARGAMERAAHLARAAGMTISLDLNLRRRIWSDEAAGPVLRSLAATVDILLGSPDDLAVVTGLPADDDPADLARAALAFGPSIAVAKLGAEGALAVDRDALEMPIIRSGLPLPVVVDPVGAGDAFCAGFIAARLEGADLAVALERANACGASAAAALGDQTGLPDRAELAAILRSGVDGGGSDTIR